MAGKKVTTKKQESEEQSSTEEYSGEELEYSNEQLEEAEEILETVEVSNEDEQSESNDEKSGSNDEKSGSNENDEDDEIKRTIFIKDIDYDLREEELKTQMERLGELVRVTVPLTHDQKRNKGFAYVEFKKQSDAEKALKLDGTELLGRKVMVCQAKPKQNKSIYTLFVKNLSYNTTKDELREHFEKYGKIFNVSLPMDSENEERNKGFCFIEYNDEDAIKKAMKAKNVVNDRHLYLSEGNKNEERNKKRSEDRLYGKRDSNDGNRREGGRFNDRREGGKFNDRREGGRFNNRRDNDDRSNNRRDNDDRSNNRREGGRFNNRRDGKDQFDRKNNNRFEKKGKFQDKKENSKSSNKIVFDDSE